MKTATIKTSFLEKILSHLFFLFFVAQIFSPSIGERTIYIEIIIAILNPYFIIWILKRRVQLNYILSLITILTMLISGRPNTIIKFLALAISVTFLYYAKERNLFYMKQYLYISILIAILQFIFTFTNPMLARQLGPENISKMIWGEYATATFTNFYTIFWFPRVSGLSREAGFFASLLIAVIFLNYINANRKIKKTSLLENIILYVGYIISFSKISLILFPVFLLEKTRNYLNKIPSFINLILFVGFMVIFWQYNTDFLLQDENVSFMHRFIAYVLLINLEIWQLLFGVDNLLEIHNNIADFAYTYFRDLAGFGGFIIHNGLLVTILFYLLLYLMRVSSTGIIALLLLTINVQVDTNQNFVVLAYYIILKYYTTGTITKNISSNIWSDLYKSVVLH